MAKRAVNSPYALLPLELIDEPTITMRQTFDEEKLHGLTESIRDYGVIQPIVVTRRGKRYEINDGHRRYIAAQACGLREIPSVVHADDDGRIELRKVHANLWREDCNPGEEACYLSTLLDQAAQGDVDRLCVITGLKRAYVEDRLILLRGDERVLDSLKLGKISFAVAKELNKVTDAGYRVSYLDAAIAGGATARVVREWRERANAVPPADPPPPTDGTNQFTSSPPPTTSLLCVGCNSADDPWDMELVYFHRRCRKIILDPILAQFHGAPQKG